MDTGLLIVRLVLGLTMAAHGLEKPFGWFGGQDLTQTGATFAALGYRHGKLSALAAGAAEATGGLLLAVGLLTPLAAAAVMVTMLGATLSVHLKNGFWQRNNGIEYTLLLGTVAAGLAFTGAGSYSLDHALGWNLGGVVWGEVAVALTLAAGIPTELYRRRNLAHVQRAQEAASTADEIGPKPTAERAKQTFDVIIVGGGSAGAVLAARLSTDSQRSVLLLDAGPNFMPESYPPVLTDANVVAGSPIFDWQYHTNDAARLGHDIPVPRGRVIGGISAVNSGVAVRARPADFARWSKRGIEGWDWYDVFPAFKALENTPTGDDAWHGRSGPLPIRQRTSEENTPSVRAFVEAAAAVGLKHVSDFNGANQHGVGPYPLNVVNGVRVNTGIAYLTAAVRARPNLAIRGNAEVDRVIIENTRAIGVKLVDGEVLLAGEVILSGGTFGSPAILMRSGIGPSQHLSELGIEPIADLPVGDRMWDHPFFYNIYALKRGANAIKPAAGALVWTHSQRAAPGDLDLHISATHITDQNASTTGGAIVLACAVTLPKSTGRLRLASRDPYTAPDINYNFFDDENDLDRMTEVVQLSRKIGRTPPFSDLIDHEMAPDESVDSDEALRANIFSTVGAYLHPTSTVPMGADSDPTGVVDAWGRVRGVEALRVVDASILPDSPSAPTNVTTIMVAERIAAKLAASALSHEIPLRREPQPAEV